MLRLHFSSGVSPCKIVADFRSLFSHLIVRDLLHLLRCIRSEYKTISSRLNLIKRSIRKEHLFKVTRKLFGRDDFIARPRSIQIGFYGFGEVVYDLDSTVDLIVEYIRNDCQIKSEYLEKIDSFFAYNDKNNSARVLDEILKLR